MNKRCVVLEELKKGAEPFEALEAATQYYINVIMGETMPIGGADVPGLLTAVRLIDKTISEDNPEAAKIAEDACKFFEKHRKVVNVKTGSKEDAQKMYERYEKILKRREQR